MIGIVLPANLRFSPYVRQYVDFLNKRNISYEIISWNKAGISEATDYVFEQKVSTDKKSFLNQVFKLKTWLNYSNFAINVIQKRKYEKLIVFTAQLGIFMSVFLEKNYKNYYILDIRDNTPLIKIFKKKFKMVVANAFQITISSPGFQNWINDKKAILAHNIEQDLVAKYITMNPPLFPSSEFRILSLGSFNEFSINHKLITKLREEDNLKFIYIGNDTIDKIKLINVVKTNKITNIEFEGIYQKEDFFDIYRQKSDLVNIIRENNNVNMYALPNKLYEGIAAGVPVITLACNKSVSALVKKYNLGIVIESIEFENLSEVIISEIKKLNHFKFTEGRKKFLNEVMRDQKEFFSNLEAFLS